MKTAKITYWISTSIISLMMLFAAYSYLTKEEVAQGFHHLGFPDYFRVELAIAKLIGAIVLLIPFFPKVKEWAYAGFTINFISATLAHLMMGDPAANTFSPMIFLVILFVSYFTYRKSGLILQQA